MSDVALPNHNRSDYMFTKIVLQQFDCICNGVATIEGFRDLKIGPVNFAGISAQSVTSAHTS